MDKQEVKTDVYQEIANIGKALANPFRLRILNLICQDTYSVEKIAAEIGISTANASQHLQVLKKVKLLTTSKEGHHVIYSLANNKVFKLWNELQQFSLQNNHQIKGTLENFKREHYDKVLSVSAEEIVQTKKNDQLTFLDVRPKKEFEKESIANAVSIPIDTLKENLQLLTKSQQIVVYCRGPLCFFADEAVQFLQEKGYNAIRLEEEVLAWKHKGLPVN